MQSLLRNYPVADTAYGWGNLTRMAIHTAAGFIVGIAGVTLTLALWQALVAYQAEVSRQFGENYPQLASESSAASNKATPVCRGQG